jgi:hypothetical protein
MAGDPFSGGDARPNGRNLSPQQRNFARQLAAQGQDVQRQLQASGASRTDLQNIDQVVKNLLALSGDTGNANPEGLKQLSEATLDKVRKLEFDIRKKTDTTSDGLLLTSEEAPAKYQPQVSEYFKELSKRGGGAAPAPAPKPGQ